MMKLFAKQPCSFNGKQFFIGNEIPSDYVLDPKMQEKMGVITIADDSVNTPMEDIVTQLVDFKFEIPIHTDEGDISLSVTNNEMIVFTDILQTGVIKTEDKQKIYDLIQKIESEDLLIMLSALDGRKYVKDEAEGRASALNFVGGDA